MFHGLLAPAGVLIIVLAICALLGYLMQEWINTKLVNPALSQGAKLFSIEGIEPPARILSFQATVLAVALACFWSSIGVNLVTDIAGGNFVAPKINQTLADLTLFLSIVAVIPQIVWLFNYGINNPSKQP